MYNGLNSDQVDLTCRTNLRLTLTQMSMCALIRMYRIDDESLAW